jgi:hypothetical protein
MHRSLTRAGALFACAFGLAFAVPAYAAPGPPPSYEEVSATLGTGQTIAGGCESLEAGNLAEVYRDGGCEDRTLAANGLTHRSAKTLDPDAVIVFRPSPEGYAKYATQFANGTDATAPVQVVEVPGPPGETVIVTETPWWMTALIAVLGILAIALAIACGLLAARGREANEKLAREKRAATRPAAQGGRHVTVPSEDPAAAVLLAELDEVAAHAEPDAERLNSIVERLIAARRVTKRAPAQKVLTKECVPEAKTAEERAIPVERAELRRVGHPPMMFRKLPWEGWRIGDSDRAIEREIFRQRQQASRFLGKEVRFDERKRKRFDEYFEKDYPLTERAPAARTLERVH